MPPGVGRGEPCYGPSNGERVRLWFSCTKIVPNFPLRGGWTSVNKEEDDVSLHFRSLSYSNGTDTVLIIGFIVTS